MSLVQKGQMSPHMAVDAVCSGCSMQWRQYAVDAVDAVGSGRSRHSGIVVYGGGNIVFGAKSQPVDAVDVVDAVE